MTALDTCLPYVTVAILVFTGVYNVSLLGIGVVRVRREDGSLRAQLGRTHGPAVPLPAGWSVFALIPCLNEERVIANTLRHLLDGQPGVCVVVVDDGSDDATADLVRAVGADRVTLVSRTPPAARRGKGAALNTGLRAVRERVAAQSLDASRVLVCVLDADGRLTPGAAGRVTALFDDPAVGGAQLTVRIRGRRRWALRLQDLEFWCLSALIQFGRIATGTVSMGGNGQFTRLSALDGVGACPWSDSLTEDLDLGISLAARGWRVTSTTGAFVSQQGLTSPRRLLRQRTRWYHGHLSAIRRLPQLWARSAVGVPGRLELSCYLLVPYLVTLPSSLVQQYVLVRVVSGQGSWPPWESVLLWSLVVSSTCLVWAVLYWRRDDDLSGWKAFCSSLALVPWLQLSFVAGWLALWQIVTRRRRWAKTERAVEEPVTPHTPVPPPRPWEDPPHRTPSL